MWAEYSSDHLQNGKIIVLDEADTVYPDAKTMITYAKNRLLAKEQQALILIEQGKLELAIKALTEISVDSETTASLKRRVTQLRISLGGDPNDQ